MRTGMKIIKSLAPIYGVECELQTISAFNLEDFSSVIHILSTKNNKSFTL